MTVMAMTLRLDPETDKLLTEHARRLGISKAQAAIQAVEAYLASQSAEAIARQTFDLVLRRDAELLKRLSDA